MRYDCITKASRWVDRDSRAGFKLAQVNKRENSRAGEGDRALPGKHQNFDRRNKFEYSAAKIEWPGNCSGG